MRARLVNINEEILGNFITWNNKSIMFKNPPSIKRLSPWCRAIVDVEGNLYIGEIENENEEKITIFSSDVTHSDIIKYLCENGYLKGIYKDYYNLSESGMFYGYKNLSAWQRKDMTNEFYLAESYSKKLYLDDPDNIEEIKYHMRNMKRQDIRFIYKSIKLVS